MIGEKKVQNCIIIFFGKCTIMFNLQLKGKTEGNGAACMESDCV